MDEPITLNIASAQKRVAAFVIDDLVVSLFFMIIFYDQVIAFLQTIPQVQQSDTQIVLERMNQFVSANIIPLFILKIIYHTVPVWQNGMTLGKYIMKIKVVSLQTDEKPTFMTALLRALLRIPSELFFYLGFLMAFFVPLTQTFHDKFSNCVVTDVS
jgi:uncharacterized RDD family membrane protein YckC